MGLTLKRVLYIMMICTFSILGYDLLTSILIIIASCFVPVILWSIYVSCKVNIDFKKYSTVRSSKNVSAYEVARYILDSKGLQNVQIRECKGSLTDHYDPRVNIVFLSEATINSTSIGAIGVAAHEVGHAIQHAEGYFPIKIRGALVPAMGLASKILMPLILVNLIITFALPVNNPISNYIFCVIIGIYAINMLFSLITLPCEFNASSRAKKILAQLNILNDEELKGVSKVLRSAAMTYVASFFMTIIQLARMLLIVIMNRKND